jgi:signal peptidase I
MAPNLPGPHYQHTCEDCYRTWSFDSVNPFDFERLVCPNCGYRPSRAVPQHSLHPGRRLLVDRCPLLVGNLRRGDLVVFQIPDRPNVLALKRLVGLPSEQVSIYEGDLYVNGDIVRKSLDEFRRMALMVHDDRFAPRKTELPPRWLPEEDDPEWLSYRSWRCFENPLPRTDETYILDNDSYNPGSSRQLQRVFDLLLVGQADFGRADVLEIRGHDGFAWHTLRADGKQRRLTLWRSDQKVREVAWNKTQAQWSGQWEFALVDRQVIVAVNGTELLRSVSEPPDPNGEHGSRPREAVLRPLAVRSTPQHVELTERRVLRDIHYLHPHGNSRRWQGSKLGPDEYLVLGDNVPISQDGRWQQRPLRRNHLYGRVLWTWDL